MRLPALLAGTQLTSDACGAFVSLSRIFLCISAGDMALSFIALLILLVPQTWPQAADVVSIHVFLTVRLFD